jgi:hypothetical protein
MAGGAAMTLEELLADIHALEEDMLAFERKYGVRSEIFYAAYISGEEPEDDAWVLDFGEWASVYRTWLARQAEYRNQVQLIQRDKSSLEGLVRVVA